MALPSIPYRASEPSQAETHLAMLATDPARAGAAMALLPGYMSLRQDVGTAAQANADRNYMLEVMKQQEVGSHNLAEEGIHAAGITAPGGRALYYGSTGNRSFTPDQAGLVGGLTNLEMNKEKADIYQRTMQGNYQGVEGGVNTPISSLQGMTGLPVQQGTPLQIQLQGMRDSAAAARQSRDQEQLKYIQYGTTIAPDGSTKVVATHIPPGMEDIAQQEVLRRNSPDYMAKAGVDEQGNPVIQPAGSSPVYAQPQGKKSGAITGPVRDVRAGSSTSAAGSALPMAQRDAGSSTGGGTGGGSPAVTSSAIVPTAAPRGGNQILDGYMKVLVQQGMDPKQAMQLRNSGMRFGFRKSDGTTWILSSDPNVKPYKLTPNQ